MRFSLKNIDPLICILLCSSLCLVFIVSMGAVVWMQANPQLSAVSPPQTLALRPAAGDDAASSSGAAVRVTLAERQVTVTVTAEGRQPVVSILELHKHPEWLVNRNTLFGSVLAVDPSAIQAALEKNEMAEITMMLPAEVTSIQPDGKNVLRAQTAVTAKAGYVFDAAGAAKQIADALMDELPGVTIAAEYVKPTITITKADGTVETLTLLSTGLSDFENSEPGRESNVHKAIEERVHNVVVPAGETFSLVSALDTPITLEKGWKKALGLFGGGAALTVGGGICQSATTIYRAVLLAGLPIVEKRNHSLFVDHYEFYGVGLDATVFPGFHDVRFRNDTSSDIVMQAYTKGITVYVNFFGKDDGRTTHLDGPYFARSKTRPKSLRALSTHEIGWVRTVTSADGNTASQPLIATYAKPVWNSIAKKYDGADGMKLLTEPRVMEAL